MLPGPHGGCQARHTGSLTGRIALSLSGGQSLQKALEDKLALYALMMATGIWLQAATVLPALPGHWGRGLWTQRGPFSWNP